MEADESYLEMLISDNAIWDAMDRYDELGPGEFHEVMVWANDALEHHGIMVEAMFDPQVWVI